MKKSDVEVFEKLQPQIIGLYDELSVFSKKSPDGAINKFKLRFINQLLNTSNKILEPKYLPFPDFEIFDEDTLPTNSDAIFIINQYINCLQKFKTDHVKYVSGSWYWILEDSKDLIETTRPINRIN